MTQEQRRIYLLEKLLSERGERAEIPGDTAAQRRLLRSLMNVRLPSPVSDEFLAVQDEYLQYQTKMKGITELSALSPVRDGVYLWQGDITTLRCDAIVNAANSQMLGCFYPCHSCIDNCIHTYAGIQLRLACAKIMAAQKHGEPTGRAKITPAFNLPSKYVIHTVGPIIYGAVSKKDEELLASCYRSCLELAEMSGCRSIAFCCISTGEFRFPRELAAKIAVKTVEEYKKHSEIEVIFNVYKDEDLAVYKALLG